MQVFVSKSDLGSQATVIQVHGSYPDLPWVDRNMLGPNYTPMSLPGNSVQLIDPIHSPGMFKLSSDWRNNATMICQNEAERRILEVFPDYMQRNANNDVNNSMIVYKTHDVAQWPQDAKDRYNEGQRGWNYVSAVRQACTALISALPPDPTDNSHWPTVISPPIYIPPAP